MKNNTEKFYSEIYRIRRTEEEVARIYPTDKIKSPIHLSIGQEAVSVGVCQALKASDVVFGTYRGHALYMAKGGNLKKMVAELYGKKDGCAKGKGGSMHMIDTAKNIIGTSAIVGTTLPVSVGYAYGLKYKKTSNVVATFFGDGATDEGVFHESMNFAALKKLPVLFVCENNLYAIHSHYLRRHPLDNICLRARSYGMKTERIGSGDVFEIFDAANRLIKNIRRGCGPAFLECLTYRWKEHVGPADDFHLGYRTLEEMKRWKKKDALERLARLIPDKRRRAIEKKADKEIAEAFSFSENNPFPEIKELYTDVFK